MKRNHKVIVLSGGSFQGKSLIAINLACFFKFPLILCTDTVRSLMHIIYPKSPYFVTSTYLMPPQNLKKQWEKVSKIILGLLEIHNHRGEDIIIEGMHLSKDFISDVSNYSDVLMVCVDNMLPLIKRLEYKAITRHRIEYLDPIANQVKYGEISKKNLDFSPYLKYEKRINEIHKDILNVYNQNELHVIKFKDISDALISIKRLVRDCLKRE